MNSSYFRIKPGKQESMNRLLEFLNLAQFQSPIKIDLLKATDKAVSEDGKWKRIPLFFYENEECTVFEDLSGWFSKLTSADWLKFAGDNEFILAGYNDAVPNGQLIAINKGEIIRDFLDDEQQPNDNINIGRIDCETELPINEWHNAASFVDEDKMAFSETGYLWILINNNEKP